MMKRLSYFFITLVFLTFSCTNRFTLCLSSSVEASYWVELFNSQQSKEKVLFVYAPDCYEYMKNSGIKPDIIIDSNDQLSFHQNNYISLNRIIGDESRFYDGLLKNSRDKKRIRKIPLSFNLPALAFKHRIGLAEYASQMTLEEVADLAAPFNQVRGTYYTRVGFFPAWEPASLMKAYQLSGLKWQPGADSLILDSDSVNSSEEAMSKWMLRLTPSRSGETIFRDKYLTKPGFRLIKDGTVLFYYYLSNQYFSISPKYRSRMLISWLSDGKNVVADEKFIFAALLEGGHHLRGAKCFLKWMLSDQTQKQLLISKNQNGIEGFGLLNGFSSLKKVNELYLSQFYPELKERFPSEQEISFPDSNQLGLIQANDSIISQWLFNHLKGGNELPLLVELDKWVKQQPYLN